MEYKSSELCACGTLYPTYRLASSISLLKNVAFVFFAFQCQEFNCVRTLRVKKTDFKLCVSATRVTATDLFKFFIVKPTKTVASTAPTLSAVAPQKPKTAHDQFAYASNATRRAV